MPTRFHLRPDESLTHRERMNAHVADPSCAGCHRFIDPLGFAFENYNGMGMWQEPRQWQARRCLGSIENTGSDPVAFNNAVELMEELSDLEEARACVVDRLFQYSAGGSVDPQTECVRDDMRAAFESSDGDFREAVVAMVMSEGYFYRRFDGL